MIEITEQEIRAARNIGLNTSFKFPNHVDDISVNAAQIIAALLMRAEAKDAEIAELKMRVKNWKDIADEARRAIGEHFSPDACYSTGPITGNAYRDLVECPACAFIAMYDAEKEQSK